MRSSPGQLLAAAVLLLGARHSLERAKTARGSPSGGGRAGALWDRSGGCRRPLATSSSRRGTAARPPLLPPLLMLMLTQAWEACCRACPAVIPQVWVVLNTTRG